jgi:hypothetical protein
MKSGYIRRWVCLIYMFIAPAANSSAQTQQPRPPHPNCTMSIDSARVDNTQPAHALLFNACNQDVQATWLLENGEVFATALTSGEVVKILSPVDKITSVVSCLPQLRYDRIARACMTGGNATSITVDRFGVWPTGADWEKAFVAKSPPAFMPQQQNIVFALQNRISIVECMVLINVDKKIKSVRCTGGASYKLNQASEKWFAKQSLEKLDSLVVDAEKWVPTPAILWFARDNEISRPPNLYSPLGVLTIIGTRIAR